TGTQGIAGTTGQLALTSYQTSSLSTSSTTFALIPGLTQTVTVPSGGFVYVSTTGGINSAATTYNQWALADVAVYRDGTKLSTLGEAFQSRHLSYYGFYQYAYGVGNNDLQQ